MLKIGVLGPVVVSRDGQPVAAPTPMLRHILALLLTSPGRHIRTDVIVDSLWGDRPPRTSRQTLLAYMSRLRSALGSADRISHDPAGFTIHLDANELDAQQFEDLTQQLEPLERRADWRQYTVVAQQALDLWRGEAFADVADLPLVTARRTRLEESRLAVCEQRLHAGLELGEHNAVIAETRDAIDAYPYRENLYATLMLALYRSGRQAEALQVYRDMYDLFAGELAVAPMAQIQQLHQRILQADRSLDISRRPHPTTLIGSPRLWWPDRPRYLPARVEGFAGRAADLARVVAAATGDTISARIVAVTGPAGVGKTTLAVHAAHQLADRFPDGQLFVDLNGFTAGTHPMPALEALGHLLRALGTPAEDVSANVDECAGMLRSRLAGRRVLILADNAADAAQLAPIVPAEPACLLLITSRRRLAGLINVTELPLVELTGSAAVALFTAAAGDGVPPGADLTDLADLCGRLPLAIQLAAARLRSRPNWSPADLADRLRDEHGRLGELEVGERSVRAALEVSYRQLDPPAQRVFRLLGLHAGAETAIPAVAAMADLHVGEIERLLENIADVHLAQESAPGRYRLHDLVRVYAADRAMVLEPTEDRRRALHRMIDFYAGTAHHAAEVAYPHENEPPAFPQWPQRLPDFADPPAALRWLDTERGNLVAVARQAADMDLGGYTGEISAAVRTYLSHTSFHAEAALVHQYAVDATIANGDRDGEARARFALSSFYIRIDRYDDAVAVAREVLTFADAVNQTRWIGRSRNNLGVAMLMFGDYDKAGGHFTAAEAICRDAGDPVGERFAINGLGVVARHTADYRSAAGHYMRALAIAERIGDTTGEQHLHMCIAEVLRLTGDIVGALAAGRRAIDLAVALERRDNHAHSLNAVADTLRDAHRDDEALDHYRKALTLARSVDDEAAQREAHIGIGEIHRRLTRWAAAAAEFRAAAVLAAAVRDGLRELEATLGLGDTAFAAGWWSAAAEAYDRAEELAMAADAPAELEHARSGRSRLTSTCLHPEQLDQVTSVSRNSRFDRG